MVRRARFSFASGRLGENSEALSEAIDELTFQTKAQSHQAKAARR